MNPILVAMAELARGFLAYVENEQTKAAQPQQEAQPEPQEVRAEQPQVVKPEFEHVYIPHWQCMSIEDLSGEKWVDLNIPGRKAMISNKGRAKLWKSRSAHHASHPSIVKQRGSNVINHSFNSAKGDETSMYSISTAKTVLLAFAERPSWADKAPNALARSVRVYRHKNNNLKDCSLDNLEWVEENVAITIENSLIKGDERRIELGEEPSTIDHFAPLTGDWSKKTGSAKSKKVEPVLELTVESEKANFAQGEETDFLKTPFPDLPIVEEVDTREWVDVPHFVGFYQVAKDGTVRSLDRFVYRYGSKRITAEYPHYLTADAINEHNKKLYRFLRGIVLKPVRMNGEMTVTLCRDGLTVPIPVAKLLIEAFLKPAAGTPYKYEYIDGNLSNCKLSNLRLV